MTGGDVLVVIEDRDFDGIGLHIEEVWSSGSRVNQGRENLFHLSHGRP